MDVANQETGANSIGIFSELSSEPTEAVVEQTTENTETSEETAEATNDTAETQVSGTKTESRRVKAKLGDQEVELEVLTEDVDLSLVPKGLMMESDYRKKTQSLSEERKAFEANKAKADEALTELYDSIQFDVKHLESDSMKELKEYDPDAFEEKRKATEKKIELYKKHKTERDEELVKQHNAMVQAEAAALPELIPEWMDDKVKAAEAEKLYKYLGDSGYSNDEMSSIYRARDVAMIRKAMLFDEIQRASTDKNKIKPSTKSVKPGTSNTDSATPERSMAEVFYGTK